MHRQAHWREWLNASRPKTLVAAFLPVAAAWVLALKNEVNHGLMFSALAASFCLQIATNFWNDYFDDIKKSDGEGRLGPKRLLQLGLATRKEVCVVALSFSALAFLSALPIFVERGWALAALGLVCILLATAYTGGPFPLAYLGLGEVFVLIFFGWVATYFSFFVATGTWSFSAGYLGVQVGLLLCVLITINNLRDRVEDKESQKNTLVVIFGERVGLSILTTELLLPYVLNLYWKESPWVCLTLLALPLAFIILMQMKKRAQPNQQLALASVHALLFLFLWSLGVLL